MKQISTSKKKTLLALLILFALFPFTTFVSLHNDAARQKASASANYFLQNDFNNLLDTSATSTVTSSSNWTLIFDDEFDSTTVDTSKWRLGDTLLNPDWWCDSPNYSNTSNANMVTESNGSLHITAQDVPYAGKNYQSGCISSYTKFSFLYGKVDIRAKIPQMSQSWWPAFWMLPDNAGQNFEIDNLEMLNEPYSLYFNNHDWRDNIHNGTGVKTGVDYSSGFHEYEVEWSPSAIIWRVDGTEYFRVTNTKAISNEAMFLILQVQISSAQGWAGAPDSTSIFPGTMDIDYVHVYQAVAQS